MPQLDISTYLPQLFWLIVIFSVMLGVFIGLFLPKITRILQKRLDVIDQADRKIENLKISNLSLQKSYETQKNDILKDTQNQIDSALESVKDFHEKRMNALEVEIQQELGRIRNNNGMQTENFAEQYQVIIDEASELILEKLGMQKTGNGHG